MLTVMNLRMVSWCGCVVYAGVMPLSSVVRRDGVTKHEKLVVVVSSRRMSEVVVSELVCL